MMNDDKGLNELKKFLDNDKRTYERISVKLDVSFQMPPEETWHTPLDVDNISGGGICLRNTSRLQENRKIILKLNLPSSKTGVLLEGSVRWCKRYSNSSEDGTRKLRPFYSVGIEFDKADLFEKEEFIFFLTRNIVDSFIDEKGNMK